MTITKPDKVRVAVLGVSAALLLFQGYRQLSSALELNGSFLEVNWGLVNPVKYFLVLSFLAVLGIIMIFKRNGEAHETLKPIPRWTSIFGGLSFIPGIGIPFGFGCIAYGLYTWRPGGKKIALIGLLGCLFTVGLYFSIPFIGDMVRPQY